MYLLPVEDAGEMGPTTPHGTMESDLELGDSQFGSVSCHLPINLLAGKLLLDEMLSFVDNGMWRW